MCLPTSACFFGAPRLLTRADRPVMGLRAGYLRASLVG